MSQKQRLREVDGLRAIALIGVLLYHARLGRHVSGGFLGVDMFFVISGYVITISLCSQYKRGSFNFATFIRRRILRLLPALLVVLNVTNVLFMLFVGADNRKKAGILSISSLLSVSNIHLWMESNYFDENVRIKPYLHTWSLSVEWQFYLVWAVLSSFVFDKMKSKKNQLALLGVISCISLICTEVTKIHHPSAAFYNIPFRFFEFMIGAIPAWNKYSDGKPQSEIETEKNAKYSTSLSHIGSLLAFLATCGMLYHFNEKTSFPGLSAIPICTTTIFLIIKSNNSFIGNILRSGLVQWLGNISYSVYLVHWPMLVLLEYSTLFRSSMMERSGAIILSIIMGSLLNRFIEIPFYKLDSETFTSRLKMRCIVALALLLMANGFILQVSNLGIGRSSDQQQVIENTRELWQDRKQEVRPRCRATRRFNNLDHFDECNSDTDNEVVLLGDSHACGLWHALNMSMPDTNIIQICGTGCGLYNDFPKDNHCSKIFSDIEMDRILKSRWDRIRAVVIVSRWPDNLSGNELYLNKVVNYFKRNTRAKLFILGPRPEFLPSPNEAYVLTSYRSLEKFDKKMQKFLTVKWEAEKTLKRFSEKVEIRFVSVIDIMCQRFPNEANMNVTGTLFCSTISPDHSAFVYIDSSHYNRIGASILTKKLKAILNPLIKIEIE